MVALLFATKAAGKVTGKFTQIVTGYLLRKLAENFTGKPRVMFARKVTGKAPGKSCALSVLFLHLATECPINCAMPWLVL